MSEIVAIVEGQTEQTFVRDVLAEHLGQWGASIWPVLSGKSRRLGGVKKWAAARNDMIRSLKEGRYCTTMFDYYALPQDWPGRRHARNLPYHQRGPSVEQAVLDDLAKRLGDRFDPRRFIPYVQMHEFEALMFADADCLAETLSGLSTYQLATLRQRFSAIVEESADPEAINDDYQTCPSRRIADIVPAYPKTLGPVVAKKIGIETLRKQCQHFGVWLSRLENVAQTA